MTHPVFDNEYVRQGLRCFATIHHVEKGIEIQIWDMDRSTKKPVYILAGNLTAWARMMAVMADPPNPHETMIMPLITMADLMAIEATGEQTLGREIDDRINAGKDQ